MRLHRLNKEISYAETAINGYPDDVRNLIYKNIEENIKIHPGAYRHNKDIRHLLKPGIMVS
jgi:hypothetical protein